MKKFIALFLCALISLGACAFAEDTGITIDTILAMTDPEAILGESGVFRVDYRVEDMEGVSDGDYSLTYLREEGVTHFAQHLLASDGSEISIYLSDLESDGKTYIEFVSGGRTEYFAEDSALETAAAALASSIFGYESYECEIESVTSEDEETIVAVILYTEGVLVGRDTLHIDSASGLVISAECTNYTEGEPASVTYFTITYDPETIILDDGPRTGYLENASDEEETVAAGISAIDTADIDGNSVTFEDISGANLIMINFWEPWCSPCVGEIPDLEKLYETYSGDGLLILGVYSSTGMDDDIRYIIEDAGVTYPVMAICDALTPYTSDYVPTTVFADAEGNVISEAVIGAHSYEEYEEMILAYLEALK